MDDDTLPYIKQRQDLAELLPLGLQLRFFAALQDVSLIHCNFQMNSQNQEAA